LSTYNNSADARYTIQYDLSGVQDPTVVPTRAAPGSTFRKLSDPARFYLKLDEGETTNWIDLYASGLVYGINLGTGAQVLKNVIANTLYFRSLKNTDSQLLITQGANEITINANTNELKYPVTLVTNTNVHETIWAYKMPVNNAQKIGIKVVGEKFDKSERCYFHREGLFYNNNGTVEAQRIWQVLSSFRTDENIEIKYDLVNDDILIQVKSLDNSTFYWKGEITQLPLQVP
jgi:hypothetical protein